MIKEIAIVGLVATNIGTACSLGAQKKKYSRLYTEHKALNAYASTVIGYDALAAMKQAQEALKISNKEMVEQYEKKQAELQKQIEEQQAAQGKGKKTGHNPQAQQQPVVTYPQPQQVYAMWQQQPVEAAPQQ